MPDKKRSGKRDKTILVRAAVQRALSRIPIRLKEGEEFVRFSGIVNPNTITTANTVQSTQVADARIEYKANGFLDSAQVMGWLGRFFLTFLPF